MKLKVFTLRMNPATGIFDDRELSEFQLDKDVIEVSEHFLVQEKTPMLTLVLRYRELPDGASRSPETARKDWRVVERQITRCARPRKTSASKVSNAGAAPDAPMGTSPMSGPNSVYNEFAQI